MVRWTSMRSLVMGASCHDGSAGAGLDPELGDPGLRADRRVAAVGRVAVAVHPLVGGDGRGDPGVPDVGDAGVDLLLGDLVLLIPGRDVGGGASGVEGGVD